MPTDPRDGDFAVPAGTPPDRLDRSLRVLCPGSSWSELRDLIARGKVSVDQRVVIDAGCPVRGGMRIAITMHAHHATVAVPPPRLPATGLIHCDGHVVVVLKPAGLDTVPWGDAIDALDRRLAASLGAPVRVVQRLDRDTTGLIMFARTKEAEGRLAHQLRRHSVHRRYLAVAHGAVTAGTIRSFLADDRGDGLRGAVASAQFGKEAITHVEVVERLRGATLVACRLETGRKHQIRIHLAEQGHMLLGERGYVREHHGEVIAAPRILLHAAELGFEHPATDAPLRFTAPMPADMAAVVASLRG